MPQLLGGVGAVYRVVGQDEDWRLTELGDEFVLNGFMGELLARGGSKLVEFKLLLVVCTRGSDVVDREEVGQVEIRDCQLGREVVVGQCMYTMGTVDGVEDKVECPKFVCVRWVGIVGVWGGLT